MPDQYDTRIALGNLLYTRGCVVGTGVIGHDDRVDVVGNVGEGRTDELFFIVSGNYNSDGLALVHSGDPSESAGD